ncbi:MAG: ATP-binding protein, partial [Bacteroidota bacterium]
EADAHHFSNALYNLIENALKYSSATPVITLSTFHESGQRKISVKDVGIGIAAEHQAEIFDRFYRAQHDDRYKGKGFGIGLSYVRSVVEAHGGSIELNPHYKEGCEFIITLPDSGQVFEK